MRTSPRGVAFIAAHEGVVTRAYRDAAGRWTIGVGHTAAAGPPKPASGMVISRARAFQILADDLAQFERRVSAALPGVRQHEFDGAVSFDFNTGAINRASWVKRFRAGDRAGARARLMLWTKAGGRTVAGLVRRREDEARLIFDGDYGAIGPQPVTGTAADIAELQRQLARLGFYRGAIDAIAGPATEAAVRAYQASHPDLVTDGIAGAATRAALARDIAARDRQVETGAGGIVGLVTAVAAWLAAGARTSLVIAAATAIACAAAAAFFAWRYRGEVGRMVATKFANPVNRNRKD